MVNLSTATPRCHGDDCGNYIIGFFQSPSPSSGKKKLKIYGVYILVTIHFLFALPFLAQDTFKKTQYLLVLFLERLAYPYYGYLDQDAITHQEEVPNF